MPLTDSAGILPIGLCLSTSALGATGVSATFTISIFLSSLVSSASTLTLRA